MADKDAAFAKALRAAISNDKAKANPISSNKNRPQPQATQKGGGGPADTPRPPRLGLGAKPLKESKTDVIAQKVVGKLQRSAKRKRDREADDGASASEDDGDDDDSVAAKGKMPARHVPTASPLDSILAEKSKKQKKKKKKKNEKNSEAGASALQTSPPPPAVAHDRDYGAKATIPAGASTASVAGSASVDIESTPAASTDEDAGWSAQPGVINPLDDDSWATNWVEDRVGGSTAKAPLYVGGVGGEPRLITTAPASGAKGQANAAPPKRKKIRSKQKNLRKDKRPEHLKPAGPVVKLPKPVVPPGYFQKKKSGRGRGGSALETGGRGAGGRGAADTRGAGDGGVVAASST